MTLPGYDRIAFVASATAEAQHARRGLVARYGDEPPGTADAIVALGGDGLMLHALHSFVDSGKPIYGMHRGTVGFLMNEYREEELILRLQAARKTVIHPLIMQTRDAAGQEREHRAFNEVSLFRQQHQVARLRIMVDGNVRMPELAADGVLVSTPAGSSAYNFSAGGPIIPINAALLALTPISPFRPRRWRGALLPQSADIRIDVLESEKRPVAAVADHDEVRDLCSVTVRMDPSVATTLLFDPGHSLEERILVEQFGY